MEESENTNVEVQIRIDPLDAMTIFAVVLGANVISYCGVQYFVEKRKARQKNRDEDD